MWHKEAWLSWLEHTVHIREVTGSSPVASTSPNLKRTPFVGIGFRFFLLLFCSALCRIKPLYFHCNAFRVFAVNLSITHKRRFMPRKPLDVRKGRVRLGRQRQTKTRLMSIGRVARFALICLYTRPCEARVKRNVE